MLRRNRSVSLNQAAQESPVLGEMLQKVQFSRQCANCIADLVPPTLRAALAYGVVEEGRWYILAQNSAAAAKARQLLPMWLERLQKQGFAVQQIRLRL